MQFNAKSAWLLFGVIVVLGVMEVLAVEKVDAEENSMSSADEKSTVATAPPGSNGDENGGDPKEGSPCKGHGTRKAMPSTNCNGFTICNAGLIVYDKCPNGTVFEDAFGACNLPKSKDGGCPPAKKANSEKESKEPNAKASDKKG